MLLAKHIYYMPIDTLMAEVLKMEVLKTTEQVPPAAIGMILRVY